MISRSQRRLERRLREGRPAASETLVRSISGRLGPRPSGTPRLALGGAMTALLLVALGSVGGISYAASAADGALKVVKKAVNPQASAKPIKVSRITPASDQYRPGWGYGDKNHTHTGPPGLGCSQTSPCPPQRAVSTSDGKARVVPAKIRVDEQVDLAISVVDAAGTALLLTQSQSTTTTTKVIRYRVLVPRALSFELRIPANTLKPGRQYWIRILATDPDGETSTLRIPFSV